MQQNESSALSNQQAAIAPFPFFSNSRRADETISGSQVDASDGDLVELINVTWFEQTATIFFIMSFIDTSLRKPGRRFQTYGFLLRGVFDARGFVGQIGRIGERILDRDENGVRLQLKFLEHQGLIVTWSAREFEELFIAEHGDGEHL